MSQNQPKRGSNFRGKGKLFRHQVDNVRLGVGHSVVGRSTISLLVDRLGEGEKPTSDSAFRCELGEVLIKYGQSAMLLELRKDLDSLCLNRRILVHFQQKVARKLKHALTQNVEADGYLGLLNLVVAFARDLSTDVGTEDANPAPSSKSAVFVSKSGFLPYFDAFFHALLRGTMDAKQGKRFLADTARLQLLFACVHGLLTECCDFAEKRITSAASDAAQIEQDAAQLRRVTKLVIDTTFSDTKEYMRRLGAETLASVCRRHPRCMPFVLEAGLTHAHSILNDNTIPAEASSGTDSNADESGEESGDDEQPTTTKEHLSVWELPAVEAIGVFISQVMAGVKGSISSRFESQVALLAHSLCLLLRADTDSLQLRDAFFPDASVAMSRRINAFLDNGGFVGDMVLLAPSVDLTVQVLAPLIVGACRTAFFLLTASIKQRADPDAMDRVLEGVYKLRGALAHAAPLTELAEAVLVSAFHGVVTWGEQRDGTAFNVLYTSSRSVKTVDAIREVIAKSLGKGSSNPAPLSPALLTRLGAVLELSQQIGMVPGYGTPEALACGEAFLGPLLAEVGRLAARNLLRPSETAKLNSTLVGLILLFIQDMIQKAGAFFKQHPEQRDDTEVVAACFEEFVVGFTSLLITLTASSPRGSASRAVHVDQLVVLLEASQAIPSPNAPTLLHRTLRDARASIRVPDPAAGNGKGDRRLTPVDALLMVCGEELNVIGEAMRAGAAVEVLRMCSCRYSSWMALLPPLSSCRAKETSALHASIMPKVNAYLANCTWEVASEELYEVNASLLRGYARGCAMPLGGKSGSALQQVAIWVVHLIADDFKPSQLKAANKSKNSKTVHGIAEGWGKDAAAGATAALLMALAESLPRSAVKKAVGAIDKITASARHELDAYFAVFTPEITFLLLHSLATAPPQRVRVAALHVLQALFAYASLPAVSSQIGKIVEMFPLGLGDEDSRTYGLGVFEQLLSSEAQDPLGGGDMDAKTRVLTQLVFEAANTGRLYARYSSLSCPSSSLVVQVLCRAMLGSLHTRFAPLWAVSSRIVTALVKEEAEWVSAHPVVKGTYLWSNLLGPLIAGAVTGGEHVLTALEQGANALSEYSGATTYYPLKFDDSQMHAGGVLVSKSLAEGTINVSSPTSRRIHQLPEGTPLTVHAIATADDITIAEATCTAPLTVSLSLLKMIVPLAAHIHKLAPTATPEGASTFSEHLLLELTATQAPVSVGSVGAAPRMVKGYDERLELLLNCTALQLPFAHPRTQSTAAASSPALTRVFLDLLSHSRPGVQSAALENLRVAHSQPFRKYSEKLFPFSGGRPMFTASILSEDQNVTDRKSALHGLQGHQSGGKSGQKRNAKGQGNQKAGGDSTARDILTFLQTFHISDEIPLEDRPAFITAAIMLAMPKILQGRRAGNSTSAKLKSRDKDTLGRRVFGFLTSLQSEGASNAKGRGVYLQHNHEQLLNQFLLTNNAPAASGKDAATLADPVRFVVDVVMSRVLRLPSDGITAGHPSFSLLRTIVGSDANQSVFRVTRRFENALKNCTSLIKLVTQMLTAMDVDQFRPIVTMVASLVVQVYRCTFTSYIGSNIPGPDGSAFRVGRKVQQAATTLRRESAALLLQLLEGFAEELSPKVASKSAASWNFACDLQRVLVLLLENTSPDQYAGTAAAGKYGLIRGGLTSVLPIVVRVAQALASNPTMHGWLSPLPRPKVAAKGGSEAMEGVEGVFIVPLLLRCFEPSSSDAVVVRGIEILSQLTSNAHDNKSIAALLASHGVTLFSGVYSLISATASNVISNGEDRAAAHNKSKAHATDALAEIEAQAANEAEAEVQNDEEQEEVDDLRRNEEGAQQAPIAVSDARVEAVQQKPSQRRSSDNRQRDTTARVSCSTRLPFRVWKDLLFVAATIPSFIPKGAAPDPSLPDSLESMLSQLLEIVLLFLRAPICSADKDAVAAGGNILEEIVRVIPTVSIATHMRKLWALLNVVVAPGARLAICRSLQIMVHKVSFPPTGTSADENEESRRAQLQVVGRAVSCLNAFAIPSAGDAEDASTIDPDSGMDLSRYDFELRYHTFHSLSCFFNGSAALYELSHFQGGAQEDAAISKRKQSELAAEVKAAKGRLEDSLAGFQASGKRADGGSVRTEVSYTGERDVNLFPVVWRRSGESFDQVPLQHEAQCLLASALLYFVRDTERTIRQFAAEALGALIRYVSALHKYGDQPMAVNTVLRGLVVPSLRRGVVSKDSAIRTLNMGVMGQLARYAPHEFKTLAVLHSTNAEQSFFSCIQSPQHRVRMNALGILRRLAKDMSPKEILRVFVPFVLTFLKDFAQGKWKGEDGGKGEEGGQLSEAKAKGFAESLLGCLASLSACLPWYGYYRVLKLVLGEALRQDALRPVMLRGVVRIVDEFKFLEPNRATAADDYNGSSSDSDEVDDDAASVGTVGGGRGAMIMERMEKDVLPTLYSLLTPKKKDGNSQKKGGNTKMHVPGGVLNEAATTGQVEIKEQRASVQLPVVVAILKVVRLFPEEKFDEHISVLLTEVSVKLRTKNDKRRMTARKILCTMMNEAGPKKLKFVVRRLRDVMVHGYQLHVLGYTIVTLLHSMFGYADDSDSVDGTREQQAMSVLKKDVPEKEEGDDEVESSDVDAESESDEEEPEEAGKKEDDAEKSDDEGKKPRRAPRPVLSPAEEQAKLARALRQSGTTKRRFARSEIVPALDSVLQELFNIFLDDYLGEISEQKRQVELMSTMVEVKQNKALQGFLFLAMRCSGDAVMRLFVEKIRWTLSDPSATEVAKKGNAGTLGGVNTKYILGNKSRSADIHFVRKVRLLAVRVARGLNRNTTLTLGNALQEVLGMLEKSCKIRDDKIAEFEARDGTRRIRGNYEAHVAPTKLTLKEQRDQHFLVPNRPERIDVDFSTHTVLATQHKQKLRVYRGKYAKDVKNKASKSFRSDDPDTAVVLDTLDEFSLKFLTGLLRRALGLGRAHKFTRQTMVADSSAEVPENDLDVEDEEGADDALSENGDPQQQVSTNEAFSIVYREELSSILRLVVSVLQGEGGDDVVIGCMDAISTILALHPPLPAIRESCQTMFDIFADLFDRGGLVRSRSTKVMCALVTNSHFELSTAQATWMCGIVRGELVERTPHVAVSLDLLKAVIRKHTEIPEVYDLIAPVTELMLHMSDVPEVRNRCVSILARFLTEYRISMDKFRSHIDALIQNVQFYPNVNGRMALLEVIEVLVYRLPSELLREECKVLFVPLVSTLTSAPWESCREKASKIIQSLALNAGLDVISPIIEAWAKAASLAAKTADEERQEDGDEDVAATTVQVVAILIPTIPRMYGLSETPIPGEDSGERDEAVHAAVEWCLPIIAEAIRFSKPLSKRRKAKVMAVLKEENPQGYANPEAQATMLAARCKQQALEDAWRGHFFACRAVEALCTITAQYYSWIAEEALQSPADEEGAYNLHKPAARSLLRHICEDFLNHPHLWVRKVAIRLIDGYLQSPAPSSTIVAEGLFLGPIRAVPVVVPALGPSFVDCNRILRALMGLVEQSDVQDELHYGYTAMDDPIRGHTVSALIQCFRLLSRATATSLLGGHEKQAFAAPGKKRARAADGAFQPVIASIWSQVCSAVQGVVSTNNVRGFLVRSASFAQIVAPLIGLTLDATKDTASAEILAQLWPAQAQMESIVRFLAVCSESGSKSLRVAEYGKVALEHLKEHLSIAYSVAVSSASGFAALLSATSVGVGKVLDEVRDAERTQRIRELAEKQARKEQAKMTLHRGQTQEDTPHGGKAGGANRGRSVGGATAHRFAGKRRSRYEN